MSLSPSRSGERRLAVFLDWDNLALGLKQGASNRFDVQVVLDRALEKGKILVKKAYADWGRHREYKEQLHGAAIELIELPKRSASGKNSGDIRMVVDALDLAFNKLHIDTFVLVTGDSDFSPLVSKLREIDKEVIGIGIKAASSQLLIENCDEFIFYDDLVAQTETAVRIDKTTVPQEVVTSKQREVFTIVIDAVRALFREGRELVWASMVKQTIKRKKPAFDEGAYDYGSFSELLLDMEKLKLIRLEKDPKSGSLLVTAVQARSGKSK
ncbi:MAG TPA: NYN domain-containing protein [Planctomycetota bacterium]|jgi:uncharacterized protein (TIGR00288 family)|nr:NYN domain-containing protein [Planctomycetota bacterium]